MSQVLVEGRWATGPPRKTFHDFENEEHQRDSAHKGSNS